jgi:two-component system chemotaxis sensor kinase CheA
MEVILKETKSVNSESVQVAEIDPELLADFVPEAYEHLNRSEKALLDLEVNQDDKEAINVVFRAFHTIKGTSGYLCLNHIQKLAHRAESLFDRARRKKIRIVEGYADLALDSVDMLKFMVQGLDRNKVVVTPKGFEELIRRLDDPDSAGISAENLPKEEMAQDASRPEGVNGPCGEILGQREERSPCPSAGEQKSINADRENKNPVRTEDTVRMSTEKLDALVDRVAELVTTIAAITEHPKLLKEGDPNLVRNIWELARITKKLQDLSIAMRMVPLKGIFYRLMRLIRDLSRKMGKKVSFTTEGEDIEIDRTLAESLNDPLVHMMRNAMDHGIELPEERRTAGKAEEGEILLRAYLIAGAVVLEIQDDGRGLDHEKIRAGAVERGMIDPDQVLSQSELIRLIYSPGFSTAAEITDISGRGVGMDVVKENVESMRGKMDVKSEKGRGTTFTIRIPLT